MRYGGRFRVRGYQADCAEPPVWIGRPQVSFGSTEGRRKGAGKLLNRWQGIRAGRFLTNKNGHFSKFWVFVLMMPQAVRFFLEPRTCFAPRGGDKSTEPCMNDEVRPTEPERSIGPLDPLPQGDETAAESWIQSAIETHEGALLRYAQHFVHDLETARDVVQDTFLQLCRQTNPDIRTRVAQWLFTVCRNRAIDICRKERRMKLAPEHQLADQLAENADVGSMHPGAALEKSETAAGLLAQISKLPDRQQEVLRLKFHAGLSYKEIAVVMGLTSTNVGFILHTAISKLRKRLVTNVETS